MLGFPVSHTQAKAALATPTPQRWSQAAAVVRPEIQESQFLKKLW